MLQKDNHYLWTDSEDTPYLSPDAGPVLALHDLKERLFLTTDANDTTADEMLSEQSSSSKSTNSSPVSHTVPQKGCRSTQHVRESPTWYGGEGKSISTTHVAGTSLLTPSVNP